MRSIRITALAAATAALATLGVGPASAHSEYHYLGQDRAWVYHGYAQPLDGTPWEHRIIAVEDRTCDGLKVQVRYHVQGRTDIIHLYDTAGSPDCTGTGLAQNWNSQGRAITDLSLCRHRATGSGWYCGPWVRIYDIIRARR